LLLTAGNCLETEAFMKTVRCWDDLTPFGIVPLTAEACGLRYRILCDVTARGKKVLEKAFGAPELRLPESWNRGGADDPHVGCIMLAPELLTFLGVFALLENGCSEVLQVKGCGLHGFDSDDVPELTARFGRLHGDQLVRRFAYAGTAGDRNVHVMSGRVR
jgi:hypothetical protein